MDRTKIGVLVGTSMGGDESEIYNLH